MARKPVIAVVEDEPDLAEALRTRLEREGFEARWYARGDEALEAIRRHPPDLVVLDLLLPGLGGLEICKNLKGDPKTTSIPIIMLTALAEETDRIVGLELGADDYIPKPFSPREVVLRIRAVLRRMEAAGRAKGGILRAGAVSLDPEAHRVTVEGREVPLTATEFRLLQFMLERAGRVQSRKTLLQEVFGYADDVGSRTVDTHVRRLRKKLGPAADVIETVVGFGYKIDAGG